MDVEDIADTFDLGDDRVVEELRRLITARQSTEATKGHSGDAQLFLKKPHGISWSGPYNDWSDVDDFVPLMSDVIKKQKPLSYGERTWTIDVFYAEDDNVVGESGRQWFDNCWVPELSLKDKFLDKPYHYSSQIVRRSERSSLMDPAFGASDLWLWRVSMAFRAQR
ncbi:hypothetical protein N0V90_000720 [Kalmusia sp. IMI 367209]|nr:hypothetical protein N0V90_000720 [Kalmusia sp. IMI 367209]